MASGIIELEDGWTRIKLHGIDKLERILEGDMGLSTETFSKKEYAVLYTCVALPPSPPRLAAPRSPGGGVPGPHRPAPAQAGPRLQRTRAP